MVLRKTDSIALLRRPNGTFLFFFLLCIAWTSWKVGSAVFQLSTTQDYDRAHAHVHGRVEEYPHSHLDLEIPLPVAPTSRQVVASGSVERNVRNATSRTVTKRSDQDDNNNNNNNSNNNNYYYNKTSSQSNTTLPLIIPKASIQAALAPLWNCSSNNLDNYKSRRHKLIFVHVFKTAGSTLRNFFLEYGKHRCPGISYATLTHCTEVSTRYLHSPLSLVLDSQSNTSHHHHHHGTHNNLKKDQPWDPCNLKAVLDRKGKYHYNNKRGKNQQVTTALLESELDMIGGHFRLGTMDHLQHPYQQHPNGRDAAGDDNDSSILPAASLHHVIFFRNAAAKYVSGKIFVHTTQNYKVKSKSKSSKPITVQYIAQKVRDEVNAAARSNQRRFHKKYSSYLLTPQQIEQCNNNNNNKMQKEEHQHCSTRQQVDLIKHNLIQYNVTIGIVERMKESMEILASIMDHGRDRQNDNDDDPDFYARHANPSTSHAKNVSPISTSQVLKEIQEYDLLHNTTTYQNLLEFVKYEQEITDFAMQIHLLQYQQVQLLQEREKRLVKLATTT